MFKKNIKNNQKTRDYRSIFPPIGVGTPMPAVKPPKKIKNYEEVFSVKQ